MADTIPHRISDIDPVGRRGSCSVCGPDVPVKLRRRNGLVFGAQCYVLRRRQGARARARGRGVVERSPEDRRRWKYGLSQEELAALVAEAEGRCMICSAHVGDDYHLDHCHKTGAVRGILCRRCNTALGLFGDSPERLLAAHTYLTTRGDGSHA